jgi:hypothetical protein
VPDGVVNALKIIRDALRQDGFLLDIRPAPAHPSVEVWRDGEAITIGQIDDSYRIGTILATDSALQTAIDAGWFAREDDLRFTFVYHFDSIDAWLDYMSADWSSALVAAETLKRARELLPPGVEADLRILRTIRATRLRHV